MITKNHTDCVYFRDVKKIRIHGYSWRMNIINEYSRITGMSINTCILME